MSDEKKIPCSLPNPTISLKMVSASYLDAEKFIRNQAGLTVSIGVSRDFSFRVQNISANVIDAIILSFKQDGALRETSCRYYQQLRNGIQPQEYEVIEAIGKSLDFIPAIEAIIFRDGGYEGNTIFAEATIACMQSTDATIHRLMDQFRDRDLLSTEDESKIRENVQEMRMLVNQAREANRAKIHHRDIRDFESHRGEGAGIQFIEYSLEQIERAISQRRIEHCIEIQHFITKVANRLAGLDHPLGPRERFRQDLQD